MKDMKRQPPPTDDEVRRWWDSMRTTASLPRVEVRQVRLSDDEQEDMRAYVNPDGPDGPRKEERK